MPRTTREAQILDLASQYTQSGELELDDDALISESEHNGAYVQMWKWVPFDRTDLDKNIPKGVKEWRPE